MKVSTVTKLTKIVENTRDKGSFKLRLKFYGIENERYIRFMWKVYKLIHFTNMFPEKIRKTLWEGGKYAELARKYDVPYNSLKTEVYLACRDFLGMLDIDPVKEMLEFKELDEEKLKDVEYILDDKLENNEILIDDLLEHNLTIDVTDVDYEGEDFSDINRDDFIKLRDKLVYFSKPSQKFIYDNIDERMKKYAAYLLDNPKHKLSKEDRERRGEILKFTKIDDIW